MNKQAAATATVATTHKHLPKNIVTLKTIINKGSLNQLEAWSAYYETCLHSTISALTHEHGLVFKRTPEIHERWDGSKTWFMRYQLAPESKARALQMISYYSRLAQKRCGKVKGDK